MKNYYKILQVDKSATFEIINRIYKYHIKKNHPDLFEGKEKEIAKLKVQEYNEAYEILSNKEKRKIYDEELLEFENENSGVNLIKRLEEENEILHQDLLSKDNLLKDVFKELNIPYDSNFAYNSNNEYNQTNISNNNENFNESTKTSISNKYMQDLLLALLKVVLIIVFFIILLAILSYVTGNDYISFIKSIFLY